MRVLVRCRGTDAPTSDRLREDVATMTAAASRRSEPRYGAGTGPEDRDATCTWRIDGTSRQGYVEFDRSYGEEHDVLRILAPDAPADSDDLIIVEPRRRDGSAALPMEGRIDDMLARWSAFARVATDAGAQDMRRAYETSETRLSRYLSAAHVGEPRTYAVGACSRFRDAWARPMDARPPAEVDGLDEIVRSCRGLGGDLVVVACRTSSATRRWIVEDAPSVSVSMSGEGDAMEAMRMLARLRSSPVKAA
jgi:hypothetical protein